MPPIRLYVEFFVLGITLGLLWWSRMEVKELRKQYNSLVEQTTADKATWETRIEEGKHNEQQALDALDQYRNDHPIGIVRLRCSATPPAPIPADNGSPSPELVQPVYQGDPGLRSDGGEDIGVLLDALAARCDRIVEEARAVR